jgi:hypothetical protein
MFSETGFIGQLGTLWQLLVFITFIGDAQSLEKKKKKLFPASQ